MILEFQARKDDVVQKKLNRFNELKVKNFMDCLNNSEEIEFDDIERWLKIHN